MCAKSLMDYKVMAFNAQKMCLFSKRGRFYNNEDAIEHFHNTYHGTNQITNTVNLAFALSGGLSKSVYMGGYVKVSLVKLVNINTGETLEIINL